MQDIIVALNQAADTAAEDYEINKDDSYSTYIYHEKQEFLKIAAQKAGETALPQLLAWLEEQYEKYTRLTEEEEQHPTFDWAGEHIWECIYMGCQAGAKEAIGITKNYLEQNNSSKK